MLIDKFRDVDYLKIVVPHRRNDLKDTVFTKSRLIYFRVDIIISFMEY